MKVLCHGAQPGLVITRTNFTMQLAGWAHGTDVNEVHGGDLGISSFKQCLAMALGEVPPKPQYVSGGNMSEHITRPTSLQGLRYQQHCGMSST
jgi:hypothetical protein